MNTILLMAAVAALEWTLPDGKVETESVDLAARGDTFVLRLEKTRIAARHAKRLVVTPEFARARKGEEGWWFSPYGYYGVFARDNGTFTAAGERMNMPMYGWSTPRGAYLAIITSLPYYPYLQVKAQKGAYAISCVLDKSLVTAPYEDFEITFHHRAPSTSYAALCALYRDYQLARGAVRPLFERVKTNPTLKYAVEAPEIRIRQAWKPVPSPIPDQQPENEPPLKVAATFDRVQDIVRGFSAQGVGKAEFCLVGWNIGGHDGRWPQAFPPEAKLGGEAKLRELIARTQAAGYQIVPHGNFRDAYRIADSWDAEWTVKKASGELLPDRGGKLTWGGGCPFVICPQRAYELFVTKDMARMAAYGFRGLGYFDVVSILHAPECTDPRHPCSFADGARYWGYCAEESRRCFGGFASEGSVDHFAGSLDSVLYASFGSPQTIEANWKAGKGLVSRHVPIFQLVYNGIIVSNPFTFTVNFTAKDKYAQLKFLEYGGRPNFYFHSKFVSNGRNWMGDSDLGCATDEQLAWSVAKVKEGWDVYAKLSHLQYAYMVDHGEVAPNVFRTRWSNGESITVDYDRLTWKHE